jgi:hypothetical protein
MGRWLTEARKSLIVGVFVTVVVGCFAVAASALVLAPWAIGCWQIVRWLGGR